MLRKAKIRRPELMTAVVRRAELWKAMGSRANDTYSKEGYAKES